MIHGIGTDLVLIERINNLTEKFGDKFSERILATVELQNYQKSNHKSRFLAKRFSAKEAFAKALGTGISGFWFTDIIIYHDKNGKPKIKATGKCLKIVQQLNINCIHLSISDEKSHAIAFVVTEIT